MVAPSPVPQQPPVVPPPAKQPVQPAAPLVVPQSQPAKPNNKTSKLRDINMKGASKEGTDMDAFNDNVVEGESETLDLAADTENANHTEVVAANDALNANNVLLNNSNANISYKVSKGNSAI